MTPDQFLVFADSLPEPMLLLSGDGLIMAGNRAIETRLGIAPQDLRGRKLAEVVADPPEEVAHYLRLCSRSRSLVLGAMVLQGQGGIACCTEGTLIRPRAEGAEAVLMLRLMPKESAVGQFVALNRQIEELGKEVQRRRRAEEAARRQEERLRVTLHSIGDAVIVTDPEGRVVTINPIAESLTGWTQDDSIGRPLETVFDIVNEESRRPVENPALRALREGVIVGLANHTVLVAKDGTERPIDDSAAPIRCREGEVLGAVLVFRDISARRQAEMRVRASEQRFQSFMTNGPATAYIKDGEGRYLFVNRRLAETFNRPPADWIGKTDLDLFAQEEAEQFRRNDESVLATRATDQFRETATHPDGRHHYLSFKFPLQDRDGRWLLAGMSIDISEQVRAEASLRQSEERFRLIVESAKDYAIVTLDGSGLITGWNGGAEDIFGYDEAEIVGKDGRIIFTPQDRERGVAEYEQRKALAEGRAENEQWHLRKDGSRFWASGVMMPLRDGGNVLGFVKILRDMTDAKLAEERLRESEERFRTLAESIPQLAWTARPDGHIFWYNRRWYEYTGTTPEEMEGWGWQGVHDPDVLPQVLERWRGSIATGEPFNMVFPLRGADGRSRPFLTRVVPLRDRDGQVVQWFGTNTDISEQRAMEEALREEDRRKDEFLATLAHELRNPLAPIRNGLQVLRLAGGNREAAEQARTMMERQTQHMVRLVDDLLDLSRISRGTIELRKERIELSAVVGLALETCDPTIRQSGHELTVSLSDDPVYVDADKTRLAQVLSNLLNNAAKYSDRGSRIRLAIERRGGEAVVSVRDTGVGIPAPMLPKVFEMFTQVDRSLEKSHGGLGIGLAIVKRLVEMHGGSVEARSEGPGMGSEFVIRLPVVLSMVHGERGEGGDRQAGPVPRHRILVVDDNEDAASSLAMMLKLTGNEVRTAHDGVEGVAAAAAYRPDLIVLDIGMPRLNGFDACRRIREQPWGRGIFIVALTGWGQDDDKRRSHESGFDHHLVKPVEPAALETLLASLPARR